MKVTSLILGFLVSMSVAQANAESINLEGRVDYATGQETARKGQPCALTLEKTGRKEATFAFSIGEKSELSGSHQTTIKRVLTDFTYEGPEVNVGGHATLQEQITIDVNRAGTEATLIRRIFGKGFPDAGVIFKYDSLDQKSEIKCKLSLPSIDSDEQEAAAASASDEMIEESKI